jgi:aldose sugar dehydrogenase
MVPWSRLLLFFKLIPVALLITNIISSTSLNAANGEPLINDPNLKAEIVATGLDFPTAMAFYGSDDTLVLEKNTGSVIRIQNGSEFNSPLLSLNVANQSERGLLGIAVTEKQQGNTSEPRYVFLYYTETDVKNASKVLGNRLYRYELIDNNTKMVNPKLILSLPYLPGNSHNGGVLKIGPDKKSLYLAVGDVNVNSRNLTLTQNAKSGQAIDGRGGIVRVTFDGEVVGGKGILGDNQSLNKYYAYGIRNSFGMDFDPVTGKLWDTENGPGFGDEINLVEPGFNSGWKKVQGIWTVTEEELRGVLASKEPNNLIFFDGKGKYSTPEFIWNRTVGVTALKFLDSDKLGKKYQNDLFVGDFHRGNLYHFDLNTMRTKLLLHDSLQDKIANSPKELQKADIIFGQGFGGITDIEVGPTDGYLYVLSINQGGGDCQKVHKTNCIQYNSTIKGTIFRIVPAG